MAIRAGQLYHDAGSRLLVGFTMPSVSGSLWGSRLPGDTVLFDVDDWSIAYSVSEGLLCMGSLRGNPVVVLGAQNLPWVLV